MSEGLSYNRAGWRPGRDARRLFLTFAIATTLIFSVVGVLIFQLTGGEVLYSLDDPYIHLALAEGLANGHYGINPGEVSSPSSSILYPFLVVMGMKAGLGQAAPLVINVACVLGLCYTIALFIERLEIPLARASLSVRLFTALTLVLGLNVVGLAYTGLEHCLHCLLTALALLGLLAFLRDGVVRTGWCFVLVALPLVRFEGAGLLLACLVVLAVRRRLRTALLLGVAVGIVLMAYAMAMLSLGLPPIPSSVLAKTPDLALDGAGSVVTRVSGVLMTLAGNLGQRAGLLVFLSALVCGGAAAALRVSTDAVGRVDSAFASACGIALALHLVFSRTGWSERYEGYALVIAVFGLALLGRVRLSRGLLKGGPVQIGLALLAFLAVMTPYVRVTFLTPVAAADVYAQQYQMHRFVTEFADGPVAVNDLGLVSYRNERPVLDLWGLGSERARRERFFDSSHPDPDAGWMAKLAEEYHVDLAMIYDSWFRYIPKQWTKVAILRLEIGNVALGASSVAFYATRPEAISDLRAKAAAFAKTLPPQASMTILPP